MNERRRLHRRYLRFWARTGRKGLAMERTSQTKTSVLAGLRGLAGPWQMWRGARGIYRGARTRSWYACAALHVAKHRIGLRDYDRDGGTNRERNICSPFPLSLNVLVSHSVTTMLEHCVALAEVDIAVVRSRAVPVGMMASWMES